MKLTIIVSIALSIIIEATIAVALLDWIIEPRVGAFSLNISTSRPSELFRSHLIRTQSTLAPSKILMSPLFTLVAISLPNGGSSEHFLFLSSAELWD